MADLNDIMGNDSRHGVDPWTIVLTTSCSLICVTGLLGNGLVIYVVLRYAKMKTATNMYILNLAIADLCFILGLPFLIATAIMRNWVFGFSMCKIFYILTSINWFTSVLTITVMSADRYMAVCHAIKSIRYRTPMVSRIVCVCVWTVSLLIMVPIILYATTLEVPPGRISCTISWPENQDMTPDQAFILYALLLGFVIPFAIMIVFYSLVLLRLRSVGPKIKPKQMKKNHRKVTKMVLTVIAVYAMCWLPYWVFQVALTFTTANVSFWYLQLFKIITVISYSNGMLNPVLYAFLNDNFRKSFIKAFECASVSEVNVALQAEHMVLPQPNAGLAAPVTHGNGENNVNPDHPSNEEIEFATINITSSTKYDTSCLPMECKAMIVNHDGVEAKIAIGTEATLGESL